MPAHAYQHPIDRSLEWNQGHVGEQIGVSGVINGGAVPNGQDDAAGCSAIDRLRLFVRHNRRAVPRGNKTSGNFTIECSDLATEMAHERRIIPRKAESVS